MKLKPLLDSRGGVSLFYRPKSSSSDWFDSENYHSLSLFSDFETAPNGCKVRKVLGIKNPLGLGKIIVKEFEGLEVTGFYALTGGGGYETLSNILKNSPKFHRIEDPQSFDGHYKYLCMKINNYYIDDSGEQRKESFIIAADKSDSPNLKALYLSLIKNGVKTSGAEETVKEIKRAEYIEQCKEIVKLNKAKERRLNAYKSEKQKESSTEECREF